MYFIGQLLGILGTICCLTVSLWPKKWQMLIATALVNTFCALNLILIGRVGSVILIYVIAVLQTFVALWHLKRNTDPSRKENLLFLFLYIVCGSLDLRGVIDILPVFGSLFHMLATFQKDVHKTRILLLFNSATFLVYYILVGSTSAFSCICTLTTTIYAIYKYKNAR